MAKLSKAAQKSITKKLEASRTCSHPEDRRIKLGMGIYCDVCKVRVGFISKEEAEKAIIAAIKTMY